MVPWTGRPAFAPPVKYFTGIFPAVITAGDVNGDGRADVIVGDDGGAYPTQPAAFRVLLNRGNGPRARPMVPARVPRVAGSAVIRIGCSNGAGWCSGTVKLVQGGSRASPPGVLGEERFSIRPGTTDVVPVELRSGTRLGEVELAVRAPGVKTSRRAQIVAPTPSDRRAACYPTETRTIARSDRVRIFTYERERGVAGYLLPEACHFSDGLSYEFGEEADEPFAAGGDWISYDNVLCEGRPGETSCPSEYTVENALTGAVQTFSDERPGCGTPAGCATGTGSIVLSPTGGVAFIACPELKDYNDLCKRGTGAGPSFVVRLDYRGRRVIASGSSIDPTSVRLAAGGRRFTWRDGGSTRSAELQPACGPTRATACGRAWR